MRCRSLWTLSLTAMLIACSPADDLGADAAATRDAATRTDAAPGADAALSEDAAGLDAAPMTDAAPDSDSATPAPLRVLVFTRTTGFRHASITDGVGALRSLAGARGWALEHTEDASQITAMNLASVDVVVFLSPTGDVLDDAQERALEAWVRAGGGWVGIHAAADCEYDWPFYSTLVGAWFNRHPAVQTATLTVEDRAHPATAHLEPTWTRTDEWYDFRRNPRLDVRVLISIDESTYTGGEMGADHPVTWSHQVGDGRSFYTALGHTSESFAEPAFLDLLSGAVEWAAGS